MSKFDTSIHRTKFHDVAYRAEVLTDDTSAVNDMEPFFDLACVQIAIERSDGQFLQGFT
jgi:hypothetical protein